MVATNSTGIIASTDSGALRSVQTPLRVIPSQASVVQIRQQQQKKNLTALGWIAGIALGLIALSELLGKETVRRKLLADAGEE